MNDMSLDEAFAALKRIDPDLAGCLTLGRKVAEIILEHYPDGMGPIAYADQLRLETCEALEDVFVPRGATPELLDFAFVVVSAAFRERCRELRIGRDSRVVGHA